jgi:hypothetical protein
MRAGITRAHVPTDRVEDLERHMTDTLVPYHESLTGEGLEFFVALLNRETGEGIGLAIWEDAQKLKAVEGVAPREAARAIRSPDEAPTEYTKRRAQYVNEVGGAINASDWYEVIGTVGGKGGGGSSGRR